MTQTTLLPSEPDLALPAAKPPAPRPITRIGPKPRWQLVDLRELWAARELLFQLARRDVSVRFKQTIFGFAWAVVPAVSTMLVFTVFLGRLGKLGEGDPLYPLFVLGGTLPWAFFSSAVAAAGNSLLNNQGLVTKVYFPRLILPLAAFGTPAVDLAIGCGLLFALMAWYGVVPTAGLVLLPLAAAVLALAAAGVGILLSALIVAQRDFRFLLGLGLQLWMFATPCIYLKPETFSDDTRALLPLNPAYGPILAFRQSILGGPIDAYALGVSALVSVLLLFVGLLYFRRTERSFADVI
ncbi:ABC transporter permease [Limnoglobus roseus]|uniref:Transport permease protein n=1 Tax=Limnoglobus roseus TaxID=2598579 RepID=A0A5C1AEY2_9BACT|nr:ABC transporter permease [Limnoglobus roseus]QEL15548.1 ABC transporter permease [Limnoglobus roseus]